MKRRWLPFQLIRNLFEFIPEVFAWARFYVSRSLRLKLILTFLFCGTTAFFVYGVSSSFFGEVYQQPTINYSAEMNQIDSAALQVVSRIEDWHKEQQRLDSTRSYSETSLPYRSISPATLKSNLEFELGHLSVLAEMEHDYPFRFYKVMLVNLEGAIIYKNENVTEAQIDLFSLMRKVMEQRANHFDSRKEFASFHPLKYKEQMFYAIVSGIPQPSITYTKGHSPLSVIFALIAFVLSFYLLTKRKMKYMEDIASGLNQISLGNLDYRIPEKSNDELGSLAVNMNHMARELQRTIEEERRAERTKNELITNISHDLRTPLTLIMGYLRLLQDKSYETAEQNQSYVQIAYNKSEKLKSLIEDLFEYTKLTNQGIPLNKERVCLNELLEQLMEEIVTMAEEHKMTLIKQLPPERLMMNIDTGKMIRVFENLLTNAIKYSHKPGTITLNVQKEDGFAAICLSNQGSTLSKEELVKLFERFYRVDTSRSSTTGGSGLGLAIAKNIVEAHEGIIWAESDNGEIRFRVKLRLA